jgi:hypothetical protein
MDNEIDCFSDLRLGVREGRLRMVAHHKIRETMEGLFRRVRVDGGERAGVARIKGIEQRARLDSAYLTEDDSIRPPAESRLQKVIEGDAGFECIRLAFDREDVRLLDVQFCRILNNHDALIVGDGIGEDAQQRRLAGPCSTADEQRIATVDLFCKKLCKRPR